MGIGLHSPKNWREIRVVSGREDITARSLICFHSEVAEIEEVDESKEVEYAS